MAQPMYIDIIEWDILNALEHILEQSIGFIRVVAKKLVMGFDVHDNLRLVNMPTLHKIIIQFVRDVIENRNYFFIL